MLNSYSLGKNGKFGEIDFSKLRSGITKAELGIHEGSVLEAIWKSIDTNQEGDSKDKLDRQELNRFIEIIKNLCDPKSKGDTNLSTGEAKKFETEEGQKLGRKHQEELLIFLSKLSELTNGIAKVETETATNIETITYEDGHTEEVKPDGSKTVISQDGKTITEKDASGKTTKETVKTDDGETVTEYEPSSTNPKKQTKTNKDSQSVILYTQGKPIKQTTTINETGEVQEFDFVEEQPVLKKTTNPKTGETVVYSDGKPASRSVTTETEEGTRVSNTVYDGNNSTEKVSINGKERYQKKVIDDREYEVSYDENGNTTGVIVQYGESVKAIAKKFGVEPEDLVKANAHLLKGRKRNFNPGDAIVIPRKMQADEYVNAQKGRKDAEGAKADYRAAEARRKAEAARRKAEADRKRAEAARRRAERQARIGTEIVRGQTGYYVTRTSDGNLHFWNPQKKEISAAEFKKHNPTIYKNVTEAQRGATQRIRTKYDIPTIKNQSYQLAKKIHNQISGASVNENTINMLRGITPENAAFVISEYQRMYKVSLAKDIDNEWGLDIETVKEHICKKLVEQAKNLGIKGIYYGDYLKINDLNTLQKWINNVSSIIIITMSSATETYYATDAEEAQRRQSAQKAQTAKDSAKQIVKDLIDNTKFWNDVDKIEDVIARIDNPEELKEVNRLLTLNGYPPTDKYSPIENFIYQEANHYSAHVNNSSDYLEKVVQDWINRGILKGQEANQAQARMAARVLYDGGDGFGTNKSKVKTAVYMIKCPKPTGNREADNAQAREVYRLVNAMISRHNTFYGLGRPCTDLLDYCRGEMWEKEVKFLNGILAENNAIQGEEKAQAISDLTQEAVEYAGTNIEYLEQAIRAIDSPTDRIAVEKKLAEYCKKKGINPQIKGQAYLQAILYDECDKFMGISTDHKEIRKFNEMLIERGAYTEAEIVNLRAEQAALQILEGDFDNIKDAVEQIKDPKVLAKVEALLKTKGYNSLDDFLSKKLNHQTNSDLINAELASKNLLPDNKAADVAYRLIKNSLFNNRAQGFRAIRNDAVAKSVDEKLKKEGSSLAEAWEQFKKEKAKRKGIADFWDGLGKFIPVVGSWAEFISDAYRTNTDGSDNLYLSMDQALNLTPQQKDKYARTVQLMEENLAQMEKAYEAALGTQGAVSEAVNFYCEYFGIGTTKEEIDARIAYDKETIKWLKVAAEGKLGKRVDGRTVPVTFEEYFKERNIGTNFNFAKVQKVADQAQRLVAMDYAKREIAVCWKALSSSDYESLSLAIIKTLEKLTTMTGEQFSLAKYCYTVKGSRIYDSKGKLVSEANLKMLAKTLKEGLSNAAIAVLDQGIPPNIPPSKIDDLLEKSYNKKKEGFKQEFKDAFGQDCPDEMVDKYISTIQTGTTVVNIAAIIGAAILTAGYGALAVFTAVGATSLTLNGIEYSTDANGLTNEELTSALEQAAWDGALAAFGMKVGQFAEGYAQGLKITNSFVRETLTKNIKHLSPVIKDPNKLAKASVLMTKIELAGQETVSKLASKIPVPMQKQVAQYLKNPTECKKLYTWIARAQAAGIEVTSDTLQSYLQMYCQEGRLEFDEQSFYTSLVMNIIGHARGAKGDIKARRTTPDTNKVTDGFQAKVDNFDVMTPGGTLAGQAITAAITKLIKEAKTVADFDAILKRIDDILATDTKAKPLGKKQKEALLKMKQEVENAKSKANSTKPTTDKPRAEEPKADEPKVDENAEGAKVDENASVNAKQNTDTHVKNINDIKDMSRMRFTSLNETMKFFQDNGFVVEKLPGTYQRFWGNSTEYRCTSKDGSVIYQFSVKPDGTTQITSVFAGSGKKGDVTTNTTEKANTPKVEQPKVDESKVDEPKADEPKADEPNVKDDKKVEEQKVDQTQEGVIETKDRHMQSKEQRLDDYNKMSPEELAVEYQKLKMLDAEARREIPRQVENGTILVTKYQDALDDVKNVLYKKGYELTRTKDGNGNTIYGTKPKADEPRGDEPKTTSEDPIKATSLRKKLGNQLFAIYQAVENGIATLKDITGYNKLKTVITNQFKNSPTEMSELLNRLNNKAKKLGLSIIETSVDRSARMGKSLAKYYDKIMSAIDNLSDMSRFNKLLDKITTKFSNFKDDMKTLIDKLYEKAQSIGLSIKESITDVYTKSGIKTDNVKKGNQSNIEPRYRRTSDEFIPDELVRNAGNNGEPINENYVQASKDLREHYNQAIANGTYADSYESYVATITQGHKIAYGGFDGQHTWYGDVGQGHIDVNPGQIRSKDGVNSNRIEAGKMVEDIAKTYGDKYSTNDISKVKLEGIPNEACPSNIYTRHWYPDSKYMRAYFEQMQRTAKEALELIEKGAPQDQILAKLAEHYQYAANARPFGQINNSLFMNEINTLLQKAGMKPMPHGILDLVAQRLQPDAFKKYFIDEYKKTALDAPSSVKPNGAENVNGNSFATGNRSSSFQKAGNSDNVHTQTTNSKMHIGERFEVDTNTKIELPNGQMFDFSDQQVLSRLQTLAPGESIYVGRSPSGNGIVINDPTNMVSRDHLKITRMSDGRLIVENVGQNDTIIHKTTKSDNTQSSKRADQSNSSQRAEHSASGKNSNIDYSGKSDKYFDYTNENLNETNIHTRDGQVYPEDIGVGQWCNGYQSRTSNIDVVDLRGTALFKADVAYNPKTNASIIKIKGIQEAGYSRPSDLEIRINGKLSEADARELIKYLEDRIPNLRTMAVDVETLQKHTADFLNSKIGNASGASGANRSSKNADPIKERAYQRFDKNAPAQQTPSQGILNQNAQYAIDIDNMPQLKLYDGTVIDLNHPQIKSRIANLKEGEFLTIGREGDIAITGGDTLSRHHILITRHNGQIVMKDISANGNTTCYTRPKASNQSHRARTSRDEAYDRFNQRQESINAPQNAILDRTQQYALDLDNLPKLKLIDGTIVDLDAAGFKNVIANLREGEFLTIGRDGFADIGVSSDSLVSRHHILITRHNGQIVMKDISANGRTYCRAKDAEPFDNTSSRARRSEAPKSEQMTPEQKQARIEELEAEVRTAPVAQILKEKYKDILDPKYVFTTNDPKGKLSKRELIGKLRRSVISMSQVAHPDKHGGNISIKLQQKINEISTYLQDWQNVDDAVVNRQLNELREYVDDLLNVDAKNAEIAKLKGDNGA